MKKIYPLAFVIVGVVLATWLFARSTDEMTIIREGKPIGEKVVKSEREWREQLTAEQFKVTRQRGTETCFTGQHWNSKDDGVYECVCCGQPLFQSGSKYNSGTGWPSFFQPIDIEMITTRAERRALGSATEVICSRCDAHLGHVFDDGPAPTGLRYCINSAALRHSPKK